MVYGYYTTTTNTDTKAYLVYEYSSGSKKVKTDLHSYEILFTCKDGTLLPVNSVYSTGTSKTLTTESFDPFGEVYYYNSNTSVSANNAILVSALHIMYTSSLDLRYSFNTGSTLTIGDVVYVVCSPQSDGQVKLASNPIAFSLPTTEDGLIYKRIGKCYSTY